MRALITGGDSGIGRAVAIAFAREGADVAIVHMPEEQDDAASTTDLVQQAGRKALAIAGDVRDENFCTDAVDRTVAELGGLDILVLNAAYQENREGFETIPTEEFDRVFRTNIYSMMWFGRAALPHLKPGSSIISTTSIQAFNPSPQLIDYAMTKAAQVAFTKALAEELGPKGIRVNAVAPGPIWTPLIPATSWPDKLPSFGQDTPLGRAGQPAELASTLRAARLARGELHLGRDRAGDGRQGPLGSTVTNDLLSLARHVAVEGGCARQASAAPRASR